MTTNVFTLQELSRAVGIPLNVIGYHRMVGHIPEPGYWGGRRVYDQEQYGAALAFFRSRKKWQRLRVTQQGEAQ